MENLDNSAYNAVFVREATMAIQSRIANTVLENNAESSRNDVEKTRLLTIFKNFEKYFVNIPEKSNFLQVPVTDSDNDLWLSMYKQSKPIIFNACGESFEFESISFNGSFLVGYSGKRFFRKSVLFDISDAKSIRQIEIGGVNQFSDCFMLSDSIFAICHKNGASLYDKNMIPIVVEGHSKFEFVSHRMYSDFLCAVQIPFEKIDETMMTVSHVDYTNGDPVTTQMVVVHVPSRTFVRWPEKQFHGHTASYPSNIYGRKLVTMPVFVTLPVNGTDYKKLVYDPSENKFLVFDKQYDVSSVESPNMFPEDRNLLIVQKSEQSKQAVFLTEDGFNYNGTQWDECRKIHHSYNPMWAVRDRQGSWFMAIKIQNAKMYSIITPDEVRHITFKDVMRLPMQSGNPANWVWAFHIDEGWILVGNGEVLNTKHGFVFDDVSADKSSDSFIVTKDEQQWRGLWYYGFIIGNSIDINS